VSTTRKIATIVAAFALVGVVLFVARRQGEHRGPQLTKTQLVAQADAICKKANAAGAQAKLPSPIPYHGSDAEKKAWLAAFEKRTNVLLDEVHDLAKLVPPKDIAQQWKQAVDGLDSAASRLADVSTDVEKGNQADGDSLLADIGRIGASASSVMRNAGTKVCGHSSNA
jgi:hypothetical protein